jgi:hypothetical protein
MPQHRRPDLDTGGHGMIVHAVLIAGGGSTGLMLAGELKLAQVDVAIVERRANQDLAGTRARGLHSRTIEVLDQRGLAERFLREGRVAQIARFGGIPLDISDCPTRHNYGLALAQKHVERLLAEWVAELDVPIAMLSGLDIRYDLGLADIGARHPLLGRRMPDLDLAAAVGPLSVFTLLHDARPLLLNLGEPGGLKITPWADRVQLVDATSAGQWELPALGRVPAPEAVLVRPDGYVAWVGDRSQCGLADALTTWFGPPIAS